MTNFTRQLLSGDQGHDGRGEGLQLTSRQRPEGSRTCHPSTRHRTFPRDTRDIRAGRLLVSVLSLIILSTAAPSAEASKRAAAMSCHATCRPTNSTSPINSQCFSDCSGCISIASQGCTNYFFPVWNGYTSAGSSAPQQDYASFYCLQTCPLPGWAWALMAVGIVLILASLAFACYSCVQRRRGNREAALAHYQSQLEQGGLVNPYTQYYVQAYHQPLSSYPPPSTGGIRKSTS